MKHNGDVARGLAGPIAGLILVGACSAVPNMDAGGAGCQNARGIGPTEGEVAFERLLVGRSPQDAASVAKAQGHTVVFNVQIEGYGECWCVPPPEGDVVEAWWGSNGALWLRVDGVDEGHTAQDQPPLGWGC